MQEYAYEFAQQLYLNPDEFSKMSGLWCIRLGHNRAKPNYQVGPKSIECYSLHFVAEGQLLFQYGDHEVVLKAGDIGCLFPDESYSYRIHEPDKPLRLNWIAFQGPQAGPLLHALGFSPSAPFQRDKCSDALWSKLSALLAFTDNQADGVQEIGISLGIQERLYSVFAELMNKEKETVAVPNDERSAPLPWFQRSLDFIHLHYMEGISVKEAAEAAGVHRSYFADVFKKMTGVSPNRYLYQLKMEKAKALIGGGERTISEVAYTVGYPSLYSFSRAYRNYYGHSPSSKPGYKRDLPDSYSGG